MLERRSALAAHRLLQPGAVLVPPLGGIVAVTLAERRPLSIFQVSAFAGDFDEAATRLTRTLGIEMPAPNRFTGNLAKSVRALGPGIWQIVGSEGALPDPTNLRAALSGVATVVDLSHARTALQVSGACAARTLAKHCGLDLYAARFPAGSATNTRFGHIGMTLARLDDTPVFELLVFRGYAEFVFDALVEAAGEFGLQVNT